MQPYDLDTRRLLAAERVAQLKRDARQEPARRRRVRPHVPQVPWAERRAATGEAA
jgi:hypothetical protein